MASPDSTKAHQELNKPHQELTKPWSNNRFYRSNDRDPHQGFLILGTKIPTKEPFLGKTLVTAPERLHMLVAKASATDLRGRIAWRELLERVRKGGVDLVLVTKLDRAFLSAKDTYDNPSYLDNHKVGFVATTQPIDTSTSTGKLLLGVLAAVAEFEKALIIERTKEGLARAKAQGKRLGRPPGSKDKRKRSKRGYLLRWAG